MSVTGKVIFLNEDTEVTNFGEHLLRLTVERLFDHLRVAPRLLAGAHVPGIGLAQSLEDASVPTFEVILNAIRQMARAGGIGGSRNATVRMVELNIDELRNARLATTAFARGVDDDEYVQLGT